MPTNIAIDDKLMRDALRETVELGLRTLLVLRKQAKLRELRGKVVWEGALDAMRSDG